MICDEQSYLETEALRGLTTYCLFLGQIQTQILSHSVYTASLQDLSSF